jgi:hypothetical protein
MLLVMIASLGLLGLSGALIDMHRRAWHAAQSSAEISESTRRFALDQYRRRLQASGMIGFLGVLIGIWPIVPREPAALMFYLGALLAGWCWIMLLAARDLFATRQHFYRLRKEQLAAHHQFVLEMQAAKGQLANEE